MIIASSFLFFSKENLVESKHHRLARSLRSGPTDRDMKPDAKTRNLLHVIIFVCLWQLLLLYKVSNLSTNIWSNVKMIYFILQEIVRYPPTKTLTSEEEDLVWKFRFYLCNQKKVE